MSEVSETEREGGGEKESEEVCVCMCVCVCVCVRVVCARARAYMCLLRTCVCIRLYVREGEKMARSESPLTTRVDIAALTSPTWFLERLAEDQASKPGRRELKKDNVGKHGEVKEPKKQSTMKA